VEKEQLPFRAREFNPAFSQYRRISCRGEAADPPQAQNWSLPVRRMALAQVLEYWAPHSLRFQAFPLIAGTAAGN
jgi:hypothetical protein